LLARWNSDQAALAAGISEALHTATGIELQLQHYLLQFLYF
jgi:hypothetical protein